MGYPWVGKTPWSRRWQPTPKFLPEELQGQRNLVDYSPWDCRESDIAERMNTHTSLHITNTWTFNTEVHVPQKQ